MNDNTIQYHNPENVPADKVPKGWRFLTVEERKHRSEMNETGKKVGPCRVWLGFGEADTYAGGDADTTYIVPDTQPEPAQSPWIAFSERKPTERDGDVVFMINAQDGGKGMAVTDREQTWKHFTHWMPASAIPPLPVERKKSQEELDKEAMWAWADGFGRNKEDVAMAFLAGLRHARAQGKEGV